MVKIRVFAPKERQNELAGLMEIQASYDGFVVGQAQPTHVEEIKRQFPVEDMSYLVSINLKNKILDTSKPRLTIKGSILEHPAYTHTKKMKMGPHHYITQFIGPVKHLVK
jgi:hypothetical protein